MRLTFGKTILVFVLLTLGMATAASAQTNIVVLGTGRVAFDMKADAAQPAYTLADVSGFVYRAYMPATASTAVSPGLTITCAATATAGTFQCTFPLTALPLSTTAYQSLAVSAGLNAADGVVESAKATAPFVLRKGVPPATPQAGMSVLP